MRVTRIDVEGNVTGRRAEMTRDWANVIVVIRQIGEMVGNAHVLGYTQGEDLFELAHLKDRLHGETFKTWERRCRTAVARALHRRGGWNGATQRLVDSFTEGTGPMKKEQVEIGSVYAAKVSGNVVPVVIDEEHPSGGWTGTNQETNRQVRVKTARRLRCPWEDYLQGGDTGDEGAEEEEDEARGKRHRMTSGSTGSPP